MPIFIVRMDHPDGDGWGHYVLPHVLYLKQLIQEGKLLASGPLKGTPFRSGFLIMQGASLQEIEDMVAKDPFSPEGLICDLRIEEWDPLFGCLSEFSSGKPPAELQSLFPCDDPS
ncbi:YciI-like protein [Gluconobacter japonicus]|uniref:YciI family protein n=1 Tax=Acetobacter sp. P5B1 TaxID=2762620 RepID=UPI0007C7AF5A|nr:YciI family protein [Acetobacter sp. P5B1]OAG71758.1 YciI-like protein [Gluconobacter japonicus]